MRFYITALALLFTSLAHATSPDVALKSLEGKTAHLSDTALRGKVLLIANTASECGYTPQYAGLETLYKKYKDQGLVVLGFPSNDFGGQEPGTDAAIKKFVQTTYNIDFPMFSKAPVSGAQTQPLFAWLIASAPTHDPIAWNFEKFLLNRDHKVVARFKSDVTPDSPQLAQAIEQALHAL